VCVCACACVCLSDVKQRNDLVPVWTYLT
jgi:hypothetical protein